jgi:hypothetical protein
MRAWVIRCGACLVESIYDDIPEDIESFFLPKAPTFPAEGLRLTCPACNSVGNYQRSGLRYGDDRMPDATRLARWSAAGGKAGAG